MLIFSILFIDPYFLQNSLADHLLEKSKDESLSFHKNWRMKVARENFKNEIACIIIEPIPANNGLLIQDVNFLKGNLCDSVIYEKIFFHLSYNCISLYNIYFFLSPYQLQVQL